VRDSKVLKPQRERERERERDDPKRGAQEEGKLERRLSLEAILRTKFG
jgi:hypothetical protein